MDSLIGREIGRYVITEKLGEGGMAVVYRAHQPSLDRDVAIKVLTGPLARDEEFVTRFRREALAAGALGHANILTIHDAGTTGDGLHYIVMEYAPGGSLKDLLDRGPLPAERARNIAAQIADALHTAHQHGIVHRDLKPSNILFARDGRPLLMDFGVALTAASTRLTQAGMTVGTPEYMSPEQAQGLLVDGRSDIYSLGVLLYEMLTGDVPFLGDTPLATLYQHVHNPMPEDRLRAARVPTGLMQITQRAVAKHPEDRYATAGQMAAALRGQVPAPAPVPSPARAQTPTRVAPQRRVPTASPQPSAAPKEKPRAVPVPSTPRKRKRGRRWLVIAVVLVTISCGGCWIVSQVLDDWQPLVAIPDVGDFDWGGGTQDAQTATAMAQAVGTREANETAVAAEDARRAATATAQAAQGPEPLDGLSLLAYDDFSEDSGKWDVGFHQDELLSGSRTIANGSYVWDALAESNVRWWALYGTEYVTDFLLRVVVRRLDGPLDAGYGVVFRHSADDQYMFRVRDTGEYQVTVIVDGNWSTLLDWTPSSAIVPGGANSLMVVAEGPDLGFVINDELVDWTYDSALSEGRVGLIVSLTNPGDEASFEFDEFEVQVPAGE